MRTIMLTLLLSVAAISSFAQTNTYRECTSQVEAINKMPLRMAHLVPVDSLGKYMYLEFAAPSLCDHSDVTADIDYRQATSFATLFYDEKGRVRKTINGVRMEVILITSFIMMNRAISFMLCMRALLKNTGNCIRAIHKFILIILFRNLISEKGFIFGLI